MQYLKLGVSSGVLRAMPPKKTTAGKAKPKPTPKEKPTPKAAAAPEAAPSPKASPQHIDRPKPKRKKSEFDLPPISAEGQRLYQQRWAAIRVTWAQQAWLPTTYCPFHQS